MWRCAGCGCAVRSFQPPIPHEGQMWAWVRRRQFVRAPEEGESWLTKPIEEGHLKSTEVPADCKLAMVLNVMTS